MVNKSFFEKNILSQTNYTFENKSVYCVYHICCVWMKKYIYIKKRDQIVKLKEITQIFCYYWLLFACFTHDTVYILIITKNKIFITWKVFCDILLSQWKLK